MASRLDRSLKLVWLVIGSLLLLGLMVGVIASAVSFFASGGGGSGSESAAVPAGGRAAERGDVLPVRYGLPKTVPGTTVRVVELRAARREGEGSAALSSRSGSDYALVNLAFLGADGSARLLLDRAARIDAVDLPPADSGAARGWIAYRIAFADTDGDGRLSLLDRTDLYASGPGGEGFRRVLPAGLRALAHAPAPDGRRMLVLALQTPADTTLPQERWAQRALLFDPATGATQPLGALDSLAARAAALLGTR